MKKEILLKKKVPKIALEGILVITFEQKIITVFIEEFETIKNIKLQIKYKLNNPLKKQFLYLKEILLEDNLK